jgi:hypothetical protein
MSALKMKTAGSRTLLAANQFITEESRNKKASNKSWFTVYDYGKRSSRFSTVEKKEIFTEF